VDESNEATVVARTESRSRWRRAGAWILVLLAAAGLIALARIRPAPPPEEQPPAASPHTMPAGPPANPDEQRRRMVLGVWEDDYQGHRTMTLLEDGTGTMVVELSGWRAAMSAARLRFDMEWSVESGRLKKRTVGGEPAAQVQMILKTMGDRVDEPIVELTPDRLVLLDADGKTKYHWRRVDKDK
jgi:hypothetical protein